VIAIKLELYLPISYSSPVKIQYHTLLAYRSKMPHAVTREALIVKAATEPPLDPAHSAAFIFLHGLGDDAHGLESMWSGIKCIIHHRTKD